MSSFFKKLLTNKNILTNCFISHSINVCDCIEMYISFFLLPLLISLGEANTDGGIIFNYPNVKDDVYEQPVKFMAARKTPHEKGTPDAAQEKADYSGIPYDWPALDAFLDDKNQERDHNRLKRESKKRRGRRRNRQRQKSTTESNETKNSTSSVPVARRSDNWDSKQQRSKYKRLKGKNKPSFDTYEPPVKEWETNFVEMPKDLYQAHLRPGVIFRIHMAEAILKMQYRNYGEDKDESVIEADVEYLRLTRKVINDEITKFEDLKWLVGWFGNRSELIQEHMCNTRYTTAGIPPTMFTHSEEYMKRACLFDNVYLDHVPYVVGEDGSLMAAVAPPVLHCDAATCTSVPFIDSMMFEEKLARSNVRTVTRCQASCRAHCRNDPDCLKRCTDRCFRAD